MGAPYCSGMTAPLVLVALVLAAGTSDRTGRTGAILLAALSLLWLLVNQQMEGLVLWRATESHGLTGADLAGLAGLGLAGWRWRRTSARVAESRKN
jgi:hypothetical protein